MDTEPATDAPREMNRTAVLAAMFAVPLCCPPMSLLACITGAVSLRQIRRNPNLRGRWLAWSSIVVGAVCATVMCTLLWTHGLGLLARGPTPPLRALMDASPEAMREHWTGPARELAEPDLRACAEQLRSRYGELLSASASALRTAPLKPVPGRSIATLPITIRFERATTEADLGLELFDPITGSTVMRWRSLRVIDPVAGEITFPPGEPAPPPLESANPKPAAPTKPALR